MGNDEPRQDEGLEIEIAPLRAPAPSSGSSAEAPPAFAVRPRRAPRAAAITALLAGVVLALILSIAPTREALRGAIFGPTPTATAPVPLGEDRLYISRSPAWGTITLDGVALPHLPVLGVDPPLRVARGGHVLRWRETPIINFTCSFTVPTAADDSCPVHIGSATGNNGLASLMGLQLSLNVLAPAARVSLIEAMRNAFTARQSSETIQPGERYWGDAMGFIPVVATQPLRATLRFVLDVDDIPQVTCPSIQSEPGIGCIMGSDGGDCRELCTLPGLGQPVGPGGRWQGLIVAHPSWLITTMDGRVVAQDQPDVGGSLQFLGFDPQPMPVSIAWDGAQWQVAATFDTGSESTGNANSVNIFGDPACVTAESEVNFQAFNPPGEGAFEWLYVPGTPRAVGCLAADVPDNLLSGTPTVTEQTLPLAGLVLHRFGIALAANATAHRYWPFLPMATAYEQQIALALARKLPGMGSAGQ